MTSGGAASRIASARSMRPRKSGTSTSICVAGERSRTARMQSTKCCAPPSRRSSRSTLVTTTYASRSAAIVFARFAGSSAVERIRAAVAHVAERATARADVAHDHERRRPLAEALADVRARGFLADRVQLVLAQDPLDLVGSAASSGHARGSSRGFRSGSAAITLIGMRDGLAIALVLDAGGVAGRKRRGESFIGSTRSASDAPPAMGRARPRRRRCRCPRRDRPAT